MHIHPALALAALAALLPAQQSKVVPAGMDNVEGPLVYTYPFGRVTAAMHLMFDADMITTSQGVITGMAFRQSQQTQSTAAYTKAYRITAWTVTMTAAQMLALGSPFSPSAVLATAIGPGTMVFQDPITVPASGPLTVTPSPFNINVPFTVNGTATPYVFDGSQGNLFLLVETTDTAAVTGTYRVDAVQFRSTTVEGIAADIDTVGCAAGGASMTISTTNASCVVGAAIDTTLTPSAGGIYTLALSMLGLDRSDFDLSPVGLPGCTSRLGLSFATQALIDTGTGFPHAQWSIPNSPAYVGVQVFTQAVALPNVGPGAAVSNAQAIRLGPSTPPGTKAIAAFQSGASWFQGQLGTFVPVVRFDGIFP